MVRYYATYSSGGRAHMRRCDHNGFQKSHRKRPLELIKVDIHLDEITDPYDHTLDHRRAVVEFAENEDVSRWRYVHNSTNSSTNEWERQADREKTYEVRVFNNERNVPESLFNVHKQGRINVYQFSMAPFGTMTTEGLRLVDRLIGGGAMSWQVQYLRVNIGPEFMDEFNTNLATYVNSLNTRNLEISIEGHETNPVIEKIMQGKFFKGLCGVKSVTIMDRDWDNCMEPFYDRPITAHFDFNFLRDLLYLNIYRIYINTSFFIGDDFEYKLADFFDGLVARDANMTSDLTIKLRHIKKVEGHKRIEYTSHGRYRKYRMKWEEDQYKNEYDIVIYSDSY